MDNLKLQVTYLGTGQNYSRSKIDKIKHYDIHVGLDLVSFSLTANCTLSDSIIHVVFIHGRLEKLTDRN